MDRILGECVCVCRGGWGGGGGEGFTSRWLGRDSQDDAIISLRTASLNLADAVLKKGQNGCFYGE